MVDQAREGLCYHRETYRFSILNIEKIAPFTVLYLEIRAVCSHFDHIENVFLYFDLHSHGKLDLKFVRGRAESVLEATRFSQRRCTYRRPKSPSKEIEPRLLEKEVRLFADTFT